MRGRARWAFAALEVVLLAAVPLLGWAGFRTVLDTTAGEAVEPELDPDEPGYEAIVEPTPVALLAGLDDGGALSWVAVAALGGPEERGGALLLVPQATLVAVDIEGLPEETTLGAVHAAGGRPALDRAVQDLLGIGFEEVLVVEQRRLAELVAPVAPLTLTLPDELPGFDTGEQALDAGRLAELLVVREDGESDLTRLARHEAFWRAWLAAVAASGDPDAVPGERSAGVGRFVRGLAAGPTTIDVIPVSRGELPDTGVELFRADPEAVEDLVEERIPFPVAARPGGRPRVRVLDGVGVEGLAARVARDAVRGGAQVVVVGNADRFGMEASRVVYFDAALDGEAHDVAAAVGVEDVVLQNRPNPNDLVDLTVVVGSDLAGAYGLGVTTGGGKDAG